MLEGVKITTTRDESFNHEPEKVLAYRNVISEISEEEAAQMDREVTVENASDETLLLLDQRFPNWKKGLFIYERGKPIHVTGVEEVAYKPYLILGYLVGDEDELDGEHAVLLKNNSNGRAELLGTQLLSTLDRPSYRVLPVEGTQNAPYYAFLTTGHKDTEIGVLPVEDYTAVMRTDYSIIDRVPGVPLQSIRRNLKYLPLDQKVAMAFEIGRISAFEHIFGEADTGMDQIIYDQATQKLTKIDHVQLFYSMRRRMLNDYQRSLVLPGEDPAQIHKAYREGHLDFGTRFDANVVDLKDVFMAHAKLGTTNHYSVVHPVLFDRAIENRRNMVGLLEDV